MGLCRLGLGKERERVAGDKCYNLGSRIAMCSELPLSFHAFPKVKAKLMVERGTVISIKVFRIACIVRKISWQLSW